MDDHLSSYVVTHILKRFIDLRTGYPLLQISLQLAGFTFAMRHRKALWALTPLLSPLP